MANYRNRKLLDLAHDVHLCQFQLPGCPGVSVDGCMPIHADGIRYGKGMGCKSHDYYHVAGCNHCHRAYEKMLKIEKQEAFDPANMRTLALYFDNGWLEVLK